MPYNWRILLDKQPSSKTISIRLPEYLLEAVKVLANKRDVPYQLMMKVLLAEKIREELNLEDQSEKAYWHLFVNNEISWLPLKLEFLSVFPFPSSLFPLLIQNRQSKIENREADSYRFRQRVTRLGEGLMQIKTSKARPPYPLPSLPKGRPHKMATG